MTQLFEFDPQQYAPRFAAQDFVHIPHGLTPAYLEVLTRQVDEYLRGELLKDFAIGDKQQALYQFPEGADYHGELVEAVAGVCDVEPSALVLSERHIKAYEAKAIPDPLAHKDRFASEFAVGFSVRVPTGSTLVLYPHDERQVNPFNSSTELRASLRLERLPEKTLSGATRVEIHDAPGDVIVFRGNCIWHLRSRPAGTVMLYLKLNSFNCDPLGEDPTTAKVPQRTAALLERPDGDLEHLIPLLGRRVDYIHRRYNRDWKEVPGVVLWGARHFTLDEDELRALQAIDGRRTVGDLIDVMGSRTTREARTDRIRYLAARGILDLVPCPTASAPVELAECAAG
jgi:hypothetical protein